MACQRSFRSSALYLLDQPARPLGDLAPSFVRQQLLIDETGKVPGVSMVELLVHLQPDYVAPEQPIGETEPSPEAAPQLP